MKNMSRPETAFWQRFRYWLGSPTGALWYFGVTGGLVLLW
jgi:hypothetical protein